MGHWAASQSLRQQLLQGFPDAKIVIEDFPAYALPNASEILYKAFNLMVTHGSSLFNTYYKLTSLGRPDARPPLEGVFLDKLTELLRLHRPDAVIATHPLCAQMVSRLKEEAEGEESRSLDLPLITCLTDVSSHPEWINKNTDCYLVPSSEVRESLIRKGVDRAKICVTGIPVRQEFRSMREDRQAGRTLNGSVSEALQYKREGGAFGHELLIMGGGLGMLPSSKTFYDRLNSIPDTHVTIITGRNERLYRRLAGRWENIEVIGYTDRVWEYMEKADMIVTKPGGITLFESIYAQVPIYTWQPSLCQERRNASWLEEKGIGWVAGQGDCAEEISEILMDRQRLARASARMGLLQGQMETESLNRLMEAIAGAGRTVA